MTLTASGAPKAGHSHAPPSSSQHLRLAHQDVLDIVRLFLEVGHTRSTAIVRTPRVAISRKAVEHVRTFIAKFYFYSAKIL